MNSNILGVDGDIIKYRCGFAGQKTHYHWYLEEQVCILKDGGEYITTGEPVASFENAKDAKTWLKQQLGAEAPNQEHDFHFVRVPEAKLEPVEHTLHSVKLVMERIQKQYPTHSMIVYFSCPTKDNWRTQFYPEYKANRKDTRKPFYEYEIEQYIRSKWACHDHPTKEADDLIAEDAHAHARMGGHWVTVSIDKDLLQIPGTHYNWVTEEEREVTAPEAHTLLQAQCIAGDSTDNIIGIPGYGMKTAEELVMQGIEVHDAYIDAATRAGDPIYGSYLEAVAAAYLNTALVTLPVSDAARRLLVEDVLNARKDYDEAEKAREHTGDTGGGAE